MEMIANGHDLAIFQDDPSNLNINNREPNGQLRARHENGHMQVRGDQAVRHEKIDLSLNSWQRVLFPWVLFILHTIVRYIDALRILWSRLKRKISSRWTWSKLWTARTGLISVLWPGWCSIEDEVRNSSLEIFTKYGFVRLRYLADANLEKKPSHIAFAILEGNNFSYGDLANLVTWCVGIGLHNITLYDLDGKLKGQKNHLSCEINKRLPLEVKTSSTFLWANHLCSWKDSKYSDDDFETKDTDLDSNSIFKNIIKINILSKHDGQGDFNKMTRSLAKRVKSGNLNVDSIDEQLVGSNLTGNKGLPDPDLLIRFGLTSSNLGFLPWHVRLTEIHDLPTHFDIECFDLFRVLLQYSKCEQRFGR